MKEGNKGIEWWGKGGKREEGMKWKEKGSKGREEDKEQMKKPGKNKGKKDRRNKSIEGSVVLVSILFPSLFLVFHCGALQL